MSASKSEHPPILEDGFRAEQTGVFKKIEIQQDDGEISAINKYCTALYVKDVCNKTQSEIAKVLEKDDIEYATYNAGDFYYFLRDFLRYHAALQDPKDPLKAYIPGTGVVILRTDPQYGWVQIPTGQNKKIEPDLDSDMIYFDEEGLERLGLKKSRLRPRDFEIEEPRQSGIDAPISPRVFEAIMNETFLGEVTKVDREPKPTTDPKRPSQYCNKGNK